MVIYQFSMLLGVLFFIASACAMGKGTGFDGVVYEILGIIWFFGGLIMLYFS